ncbi:MAG: YHS domain-containing protein [Fimbriimonadaceae bacterium]
MHPIRLALAAAVVVVGCGPSSDGASTPAASAPAETAEPAAVVKVNCPVMPSMEVDVAQAVADGHYVDHEGRRYVFCCSGCPEVFKRDPARFAGAESVEIPDDPRS